MDNIGFTFTHLKYECREEAIKNLNHMIDDCILKIIFFLKIIFYVKKKKRRIKLKIKRCVPTSHSDLVG